ncbi:MAG TPA: GNAT family N-acetyltransferase [Actinocrinis sp.]|nr:GNAT family N-acetyltransferase [Actinocrinis sp.]
MLLTREDGYLLSDGKERVDVERVHAWLSKDAYWALGRELSRMQDAISGSDVYGIYDADQTQVGFCRVVTDRATFAWLCDVYIDPDHRGRGLGSWMVGQVREVYAATGMRRMLLATHDAHEVYRQFGFRELAVPGRWMEAEFNPPPASA